MNVALSWIKRHFHHGSGTFLWTSLGTGLCFAFTGDFIFSVWVMRWMTDCNHSPCRSHFLTDPVDSLLSTGVLSWADGFRSSLLHGNTLFGQLRYLLVWPLFRVLFLGSLISFLLLSLRLFAEFNAVFVLHTTSKILSQNAPKMLYPRTVICMFWLKTFVSQRLSDSLFSLWSYKGRSLFPRTSPKNIF